MDTSDGSINGCHVVTKTTDKEKVGGLEHHWRTLNQVLALQDSNGGPILLTIQCDTQPTVLEVQISSMVRSLGRICLSEVEHICRCHYQLHRYLMMARIPGGHSLRSCVVFRGQKVEREW